MYFQYLLTPVHLWTMSPMKVGGMLLIILIQRHPLTSGIFIKVVQYKPTKCSLPPSLPPSFPPPPFQDTLNQLECASCREGMYGEVMGHLWPFSKHRRIITFNIWPIEDFNELSHHLAETVYCHLAVTKGVPVVRECLCLCISSLRASVMVMWQSCDFPHWTCDSHVIHCIHQCG